MKSLTKTLLLILAFAVSSVFAQEQLPWLVVNQFKVQQKNVGKVNELLKQQAPILNELQKEGFLLEWGQVNHSWGDDWNVNTYSVTKDKESFFKFMDEFDKRMDEKFPNGDGLGQYYEEHKDNMYQIVKMHQNSTVKPEFLVVNQNKVVLGNIQKVNELTGKMVTILNKFVDDGKLAAWGQYNHRWGDEWNVNYFFWAKDHKAFVDFWDEAAKEIEEKNPGLLSEFNSYTKAHKDNMYHSVQMSPPMESTDK